MKHIFLSILAFVWTSQSLMGIELSQDETDVIAKKATPTSENSLEVNIFYQAEKLEANGASLSQNAVIVSDVVAGAEIIYGGPWRNSFQDFISYRLKKREYVQPANLNLEGFDKITHELNLGGHYLPYHKLRLSSYLSAKQAIAITADASSGAIIHYPLTYGLTISTRYLLHEEGQHQYYFTAEASAWSPKKDELFEMKLGFEGRGEFRYERKLSEFSTVGLSLRHGIITQNTTTIGLEHTESLLGIVFSNSF